MGVYAEVQGFALQHRHCGQPVFDAEPPTLAGYQLWIQCPCGARLERLVTSDDAEADLLRSALLASDN